MSKRTTTAKPVTPLAKAVDEMDRSNRKKHPKYDEDVRLYGRDVAIYNAGWLTGDAHRRRKGTRKAAGK